MMLPFVFLGDRMGSAVQVPEAVTEQEHGMRIWGGERDRASGHPQDGQFLGDFR